MPVHIETLPDQPDLAYITIDGHWTWDELIPLFNRAMEPGFAQQNRPFFIVVEMSPDSVVPPGTLFHARTIHKLLPPNTALTVVIAGNLVVRNLGQMFIRLMPRLIGEMVIVRTRDEAVSAVKSRREVSV